MPKSLRREHGLLVKGSIIHACIELLKLICSFILLSLHSLRVLELFYKLASTLILLLLHRIQSLFTRPSGEEIIWVGFFIYALNVLDSLKIYHVDTVKLATEI